MMKVCILGFGGISRAHRSGYVTELLNKGIGKLVGVCDINPEKFKANIKINLSEPEGENNGTSFNTYTDLDEMLETEKPDIVTIALPTYLHKEKAIYIMRKGYNVFCEKPMAFSYEECLEMLKVSRETGKKIMVGQVLHFFTEYEALKEIIDDNRYGKVRSACFQRLSDPPVWGFENWYMDADKSGGCIQDLHIHDIDFISYAFGKPKKLSCTSREGYSKYESAFTTLWYDDFTAVAIGDWSLKGRPFSAEYRVAFEKAVVEWKDGKLSIYHENGKTEIKEFQHKSGYGAEVAYFANYINGGPKDKNDPERAAESVKLIELLKKSADMNGVIIENK